MPLSLLMILPVVSSVLDPDIAPNPVPVHALAHDLSMPLCLHPVLLHFLRLRLFLAPLLPLAPSLLLDLLVIFFLSTYSYPCLRPLIFDFFCPWPCYCL